MSITLVSVGNVFISVPDSSTFTRQNFCEASCGPDGLLAYAAMVHASSTCERPRLVSADIVDIKRQVVPHDFWLRKFACILERTHDMIHYAIVDVLIASPYGYPSSCLWNMQVDVHNHNN